MTIRPDIAEFVTDLAVFSKRTLNYPLEVGEILQITIQTGLTNEFEELIFQTKFLINAQDVMNQIGSDAQGFEKLSIEFQSSVKKSTDLLKMLVGRTTADVMQKYTDTFFAMNAESFARLMKFYSDLSWIKNWQIDDKPLPYETKSSKITAAQENANQRTMEEKQNSQSTRSLSGIQKSAVLAALLFVLFLLIDPPITVLGWILSLGIAALLVYIVLQIMVLTRISNSH